MVNKYTESFRKQAVEKMLSRGKGVSIPSIANALGVSAQSLRNWSRQFQEQALSPSKTEEIPSMIQEKRPQDWPLEDRLNAVIACGSLSEKECSSWCRVRGIFPHHIKQWKKVFAKGGASTSSPEAKVESKKLKAENKALQKELNRKDRALAEASALLILQKKVNVIWGTEPDSSP